MRATLMYGAGDVRVEEVPDSVIKKPTDALVRVTASVFDVTTDLDGVPGGYQDMADRTSLKVLVKP